MIIPKEQLSADIVQQLDDMYDLEGKAVDVISDAANCDIISVDGEYYTIYPVEESDKEQKIEEIVSYISAKHNLKAKVEEGNDYGNNVNDYVDNGNNSGIAIERGNSYFDENGDVWNWLNSESDIINAKLEGLDDYADWRIWSAVHYPNPDTEVGKEVGYFVINLSDNDSIFSGPYDDIETAKSVFDGAEYKDKSSEGLDSDAPLNEDYPTLLVAIESEKDAEITYKSLIEIEKSSDKPNQQVIDLLEKILKDELEHIALLSALSANKNSEYVAEDSQEQFDNYVDSIQTGDNGKEVAEAFENLPPRFGSKQPIELINGKLYKYKHDDNLNHIFEEQDKELKEISKYEPYCIAGNAIVDDDGSIYVEVNFACAENDDKNLPYADDYIVLKDELTEA